ncbi:hypothetical protein [Anabaena azotica]|nr:hypothetical protein [Anabaena azotica]
MRQYRKRSSQTLAQPSLHEPQDKSVQPSQQEVQGVLQQLR